MAFTAVYEREATWADLVSAKLSGVAEIVPAREVRPHGESQQEVNELNRRRIEESKPLAAAVGLREAGFEASIGGRGVVVRAVAENLPAAGHIQTGDIVHAVDGEPTMTTADLIAAVRRREPGAEVSLAYVREGNSETVTLRTTASADDPRVPLLGISIETVGFEVQLPFHVEIDTDSVGGPSAGFMFALGVLDAVTEGDLARGRFIAGTGTIAPDGSVGPIGGAPQKVVAAERDGATIFLAPRQNFEEASRHARSIRVVPVDSLSGAVQFLCSLDAQADELLLPAPCRPGVG